MPRHRISIWRILISRFRKHAMLHLIIPLSVGIVVEGLVEIFVLGNQGRFILSLYSFRTLSLMAGVFVSYVVIMYLVIKNDTAARIAEGDYTYLEDTLGEVNSFFGVSIIPLEEWFDPSMQVYLAML